jgi:hypothetical protein
MEGSISVLLPYRPRTVADREALRNRNFACAASASSPNFHLTEIQDTDANTDDLSEHAPPNNGAPVTVVVLGVDTTLLLGFDIATPIGRR